MLYDIVINKKVEEYFKGISNDRINENMLKYYIYSNNSDFYFFNTCMKKTIYNKIEFKQFNDILKSCNNLEFKCLFTNDYSNMRLENASKYYNIIIRPIECNDNTVKFVSFINIKDNIFNKFFSDINIDNESDLNCIYDEMKSEIHYINKIVINRIFIEKLGFEYFGKPSTFYQL